MQRCNVLYIHSHDTGRYVGPYGYPVDTPQIQRLAEQGVLFRNAFCANPTCSPSRAALLTGSYPHTNGMLGLAHRGSALTDYSQHLSSVLREHGYTTALAGVQHEAAGESVAELGYEQNLNETTTSGGSAYHSLKRHERDALTADRAAEFVRRRSAQPSAEPFFLSCGFYATHRTDSTDDGVQWHNGDASPAGDPRYAGVPAPLPDTIETRRDFADYAVAASRLDGYMGQVFDALDEAGLAETTLVICTTDHGIAFPGMKCNLTDHGTGVMLILRGPGGCTGGTVIDAMVSHLDLFPTICDVADLPAPPWLAGSSLGPLVRGERESLHEAVFAEVNAHAAAEPQRACRTERFKYIRRYTPLPHPVLPNCDDSITKNLLLEHGWNERPQAEERLYDLVFDPHEAHNLADDPACAEALGEMRGRLDRWMNESDDPLLAGPLRLPSGYRLNPVDGLSAGADDLSVVE